MASANRDVMVSGMTPELIERLDRFARKLAEEQPGVRISRSSATRALLIRALETVEKVA